MTAEILEVPSAFYENFQLSFLQNFILIVNAKIKLSELKKILGLG